MAREAECPRGVVYRDEALPLLDGEGFRRVDAQTDGFALGVEGVEIDVGDHAEGALRGVGLELGEVLVGEAGLGDAPGGGYGEGG